MSHDDEFVDELNKWMENLIKSAQDSSSPRKVEKGIYEYRGVKYYIYEEEERIALTIPFIEIDPDALDFTVYKDRIEFEYQGDGKTREATVPILRKVDPQSAAATFTNGIFDVELDMDEDEDEKPEEL